MHICNTADHINHRSTADRKQVRVKTGVHLEAECNVLQYAINHLNTNNLLYTASTLHCVTDSY